MNDRPVSFTRRITGVIAVLSACLLTSACGDSGSAPKAPKAPSPTAAVSKSADSTKADADVDAGDIGMIDASKGLVAPLADAYQRIDPIADGWQTEAFNDSTSKQMKKLVAHLASETPIRPEQLAELITQEFKSSRLMPQSPQTVFEDDLFRIRHGGQEEPGVFKGDAGLASALEPVRRFLGGSPKAKTSIKTVRVNRHDDGTVSTEVIIEARNKEAANPIQIHSLWECHWSIGEGDPKLAGIRLKHHEDSTRRGAGLLFSDCTGTVVAGLPVFRDQLGFNLDHWRSRFPRQLGMTVTGNHGIAIGDLNGDGLDDLYLCAEAGLPNRVLLANPDGTLRDFTVQSGADWMDSCAAALIVDLDNDGDQDLVIAHAWHVLFMANDGQARFTLKNVVESRAQLFSLAAADYNRDGRLDIYACGYHGVQDFHSGNAMPTPIPFHDANNGGPNMLLRGEGDFRFTDLTVDAGMDVNNRRFSYAASWEDVDNDGDLDLAVANDYGRNNLFRNDGGRFVDIAAQAGVEDQAAGMSVSWADFDRDGLMDMYISNMFSSAGNRITYQRQFQTGAPESQREGFQRFARGNTLFRNEGGNRFTDISDEAGVLIGRWAWGSLFVDLNNDSLDDLVVANGFITGPDLDDL